MNRIANRLEKIAEELSPLDKLKAMPRKDLEEFIKKQLQRLVTADDILDNMGYNETVDNVDLIDVVSKGNIEGDIWESLQDTIDISEGTEYLGLTEDVKDFINDIILDLDLDEVLKGAFAEAQEQEEANKEEDPWNQNDHI